MSVTHIENDAADAPDESVEEIQRDLGHAEAEIEHHEQQLEEVAEGHKEHEGTLEWLTDEVRRLQEAVLSVPNASLEVTDSLAARIQNLETKLEELTKPVTQEVTSPPVADMTNDLPKRNPLHTIF